MILRTHKRRGGYDDNVEPTGRDDGFSLPEILITIVLMGTVLMAVMNASISGIRSSSGSAFASQVETVLQNAADRVNRAPQSCTYSSFVRAAAQLAHWDGDQVTATYHWYVPGHAANIQGSWAGNGSTACDPLDPGHNVQLISITVTSPDGKVTRELKVVKDD
jgi:prepilin-type N-terminal cleavage/methylation domain-containing protein